MTEPLETEHEVKKAMYDARRALVLDSIVDVLVSMESTYGHEVVKSAIMFYLVKVDRTTRTL